MRHRSACLIADPLHEGSAIYLQAILTHTLFIHMLYTRKGDKGTTKTFGCNQQRISKSSEVPEALGALDELNAFLGFAKMHSAHEPRIQNALRDAQEVLFIIQAQVAGADKKIAEGAVVRVEEVVNAIEKEMPPITSFSIAGGTELSALLYIARTISRRAERRLVAAKEIGACMPSDETMAYMNRLSSLLFALARLANHLAGFKEESPKY